MGVISTTRRTWVNAATTVISSNQCSQPKFHPLSGNISNQAFCFTSITHSQPFNKMFIFNGKSYCCKSTDNYIQFKLLLTKNSQTNYFTLKDLTFSVLYWLFLLKFIKIFLEMTEENKSEHTVDTSARLVNCCLILELCQ